MKILFVSAAGYPTRENLYRCGFVHTRVKKYIEEKHEVKVYVPSMWENKEYYFDHVKVIKGGVDFYKQKLGNYIPDIIFHHFFSKYDDEIHQFYLSLDRDIPAIIWVHGGGAILFTRRLFNFEISLKYMKEVLRNIKTIHRIRKLYTKYNTDKNGFVFISDWMHKIASKDLGINFLNYQIIPNPIDTQLYKYQEKEIRDIVNVISIRNYDSRKYANDILIKVIQKLSKKSFFNRIHFHLYGRGKYFEKLTGKVSHFSNVFIQNTFLTADQMVNLYQKNEIMLVPTRQDAQGVTMCEAMSSGLVLVTSDNTSIPEFVKDRETGCLCDNKNISQFVEAIEYLIKNKNAFSLINRNAAISIREKCSLESIYSDEITFARSLIS